MCRLVGKLVGALRARVCPCMCLPRLTLSWSHQPYVRNGCKCIVKVCPYFSRATEVVYAFSRAAEVVHAAAIAPGAIVIVAYIKSSQVIVRKVVAASAFLQQAI